MADQHVDEHSEARMTVFGHHDFDIERSADEKAVVPPDDASQVPEPLVIIEYRTRRFSGILVPPALILAMAGVLVAYRPQLSTWLERPRPAAPTAKPASTPEPSPDEPEAPPIVLRVRTLPPAPASTEEPAGLEPIAPEDDPQAVAQADAGVAVEAPAEPSAPSPAVEAPPPPNGPAAFAGAEVAPPFEVPEVDPEVAARIALEDIQREAQRIRAEQAQADWLRAREVELDRIRAIQAEHARRRQAEEARRLAEQDRAEFRAEVLQALQRHGDRAGPLILGIAERYHVEPGSAVEDAIKQDLEKRAGRLSRSQRVELLRSHGLPEPLVLGDLIYLERKRLARATPRRGAGREAPRIDYDAVVRAARYLLAVPPEPPALSTSHASARVPGRFGLLNR